MIADERRAEILAVAQRLFYAQGYESTSIAEIIEQAGIAKGTFYHHFASKAELVESLVQQGIQQLLPHYQRVAQQPGLTPLQRMQAYFDISAGWKSANIELLVASLQALYRDENLVLRRRMVERTVREFGGYFDVTVAEGVAAGVFQTPFADRLGRFLLVVMAGVGDAEGRELAAAVDEPDRLDEFAAVHTLLEHTINRLLGLPERTISLGADKILARLRQYLQQEQRA